MEQFDTLCCFRNRDEDKFRILWEITSRCNEHCKFCHFKGNKETSIEDVKKILNNINSIPIKDIILTGGEPLLNKDIFPIMDLLIERGYEIDICSNGTLIDFEHAKELGKRVKEISISLDTVNPERYKFLRGTDSLKKVEEGIRNLVNCGIEVHLTFVITRTNMDEIEEVARKAQDFHVHSISYLKMIENLAQDPGFSNSESISRQDAIECMERIKRLRNKVDIIVNTKRLICEQEGMCKAGINILAITSDSRLVSCIMNKNEAGVDLLENKIQMNELVTGKKAENICVI